MENTKQTISEVLNRVPDTTKKVTDWLGKAILIIAAILIVCVGVSTVTASTQKGSYKAAVDSWQLTHDKLLGTLRSSECNGVDLKLLANANNEFTLSPDDVKRLQEKKLGGCQNLGF